MEKESDAHQRRHLMLITYSDMEKESDAHRHLRHKVYKYRYTCIYMYVSPYTCIYM